MPGADLLKMLINRPEVNAGSREMVAVLAFLNGYTHARFEANLESDEELAQILESVRICLCREAGLDPSNALATSQLIRRKLGDDELQGFESFRDTLIRVMTSRQG